MLKVDPDERPSAEELVEYIEEIGKVYRPTSGKLLRESDKKKGVQLGMLRTIKFTDSFSEIQEQLPKKNYMKKFEPSKYRSFDSGHEALPSIKVKLNKYADRPKRGGQERSREVSEHEQERSGLLSHGQEPAIRSRSAEVHGPAERQQPIVHEASRAPKNQHSDFHETSRENVSENGEGGQSDRMHDTNFFEEIDEELNAEEADSQKHQRPVKQPSKRHSIERDRRRDSSGKRAAEAPFLIEDQDQRSHGPLRERNSNHGMDQKESKKESSKYHLNPKIGVVKHVSKEVHKDKLDSQEYAKFLDLEKKRKKLYKLLMDSHTDEISEILRMHKIMDKKYHSRSIDQYRSSPKHKPPVSTKYSKLPALFQDGRPDRKQKGNARAFVNNYHDAAKGMKGQPPLRSLPRGSPSNQPDWWG